MEASEILAESETSTTVNNSDIRNFSSTTRPLEQVLLLRGKDLPECKSLTHSVEQTEMGGLREQVRKKILTQSSAAEEQEEQQHAFALANLRQYQDHNLRTKDSYTCRIRLSEK
ncbi:unnamed protein product, partial [Amoebophrya sp. A25]|eukprot:GSA25T00014440001.1